MDSGAVVFRPALWYGSCMLAYLETFAAAYGGLCLALGVLNLLLAHRSQVDAWCESQPRLASLYKAMRGVGSDPWMLLQSWSLLVRGKLPDSVERVVDVVIPPPPRVPKDLLVLLLCAASIFTSSCAGARLQAEVAESCAAPLAAVDAQYAFELAQVCPGMRGHELAECPERIMLGQKFDKIYEQTGAACGAESGQ